MSQQGLVSQQGLKNWSHEQCLSTILVMHLILVLLMHHQAVLDYLDTCFKIVKLINFSPKREGILQEFKSEIGSDAPRIRTLC